MLSADFSSGAVLYMLWTLKTIIQVTLSDIQIVSFITEEPSHRSLEWQFKICPCTVCTAPCYFQKAWALHNSESPLKSIKIQAAKREGGGEIDGFVH